jgi:ACS family tartrate transporter-like MFS transporter
VRPPVLESNVVPPVDPVPGSAFERARRKAYLRIIPLVFVSYVIAYIDRTNVALAQLTMGKDLGFDNDVFSTGFGIFFIGYILLEWPGALIAERWSARKWVSRIMITWGIIAALTAAVETQGQFYAARFALGLAEAGFFPAIVVYLRHWFPARDRARALAYFIMGAPLAQIVSGPLSTPLLKIGAEETIGGVLVRRPELYGLEGWQWMYIVWGLPAVVMGVVVLFAMTDRPAQARWLTAEEREALQAQLARDRVDVASAGHIGALKAILHPAALLLAAANFAVVIGHYGMDSFLPSILTRWYGLSLDQVGWVIVPPFVAILLAQLGVSWSSDRTRERWWHTAVPLLIGATALAATPLTRGSLPLTVLAFCVAGAGIRSYLPPFYALLGRLLEGTAAASAIGLIQTVGNLGGYFGPRIVGKLDVVTGSFEGGIYALAASSFLAFLFIMILRQIHRQGGRVEHPAARQ